MGGVVRYTEQMALTGVGPGDALAKNGPLGCALQRAGPRQEGWGWGTSGLTPLRSTGDKATYASLYCCRGPRRWRRDKRRRAQMSSGVMVKIAKILMG